ncbi:uncharacterized protein N7506_011791 [Penicillium brevicompactum]|uniref:uncharacterized protein n=1 Tax=Penicillium brevicompactum TaxID=5074 RepID=UPI00253FA939|nr:uncharacterized protein N7506_011791 [Penicillium brevicompactum]KAJ5319087.1 hypothetical protein N7506_011791 [Penicillium brevicompactum]
MPKCLETESYFSDRESGEKPPASLCLSDQCVLDLGAPSTPLYRLSSDVTSISNKDSSVTLERVKCNQPGPESGNESDTVDESITSNEGYDNLRSRKGPLFYLAHPANAQYRTDIPAKYYITAAMPGMMGNIRLEPSTSRFQRPSFKAMLSHKRTASDNPLFSEDAQQVLLFDIQPTWTAGRTCYKWNDLQGHRMAVEETIDGQYRLIITSWMEPELREALVASWLLRLWHDTAESKQAKRASWLPQKRTKRA